MNKLFRLMRSVATLALAACTLAPAAHAANGAALYQQNCASCHGAAREGGLGPSLADGVWTKVTPDHPALAKFIASGSAAAGMPAFQGTLDTAAIGSIAEFLLKPAGGASPAGPASYPELANFRLPPGFSISVYSDKVPAARGMVVSPSGIVYVGSGAAGKVYALVSSKRDTVIDKVITVAQGLDAPIGVTLMNGALYVAEIGRVIRFDDIDKTYDKRPAFKVLKVSLPSDKWHGGKVLATGPDGKLYIPVGAPCNVCNKENEPYAKIFRMNADGSGLEEFARGIRNTVGLAFHPTTGQLWFTDNGRDMLGENAPSDKLDVAPRAGMHFGFPYCAGGVIPDPEFGAGRTCAEFAEPVAKLGPHVAALGLAFNTGTQFPPEYRQQLFIAEHGSWNRAQKSGYRVALVTLHGNKMVSDTVFIDGFVQDGEVIGRPVAIAFLADGSMLVSDDYRGRIYRVSYQKPAPKH